MHLRSQCAIISISTNTNSHNTSSTTSTTSSTSIMYTSILVYFIQFI